MEPTVVTIEEIDLHITRKCDGHCPYCYVDEDGGSNQLFKRLPQFGETATLKTIIRNIRNAATTKNLVFVGGDPCQHPDLAELLRFASEDVGNMDVCVLSNTHSYKDNGEPVPIETIVPYVSELDFTLHGISTAHDAINGNPGAYEHGMRQLKAFIKARNDADKCLAIVLNFIPYTMQHIEEMMRSVITELQMDPQRDYFMVQRIAKTGRACKSYSQWMVQQDLLAKALNTIEIIRYELGFETKLDAVDAFPWCAIPEQYRYMLTPGGCKWGHPDGVLSVVQNGDIQRCALSERSLGNFLKINTPEAFTQFMMENQILQQFRAHRHLDSKCLSCNLLDKCGGGCIIAAGRGDPYKNDIVRTGHDYLAD